MLVFAWPDRAPREGPQKLEFYVDKLNGITLRRARAGYYRFVHVQCSPIQYFLKLKFSWFLRNLTGVLYLLNTPTTFFCLWEGLLY